MDSAGRSQTLRPVVWSHLGGLRQLYPFPFGTCPGNPALALLLRATRLSGHPIRNCSYFLSPGGYSTVELVLFSLNSWGGETRPGCVDKAPRCNTLVS